MSRYEIVVDDNYHFMDEDERTQHGVFETAIQAIAACKAIVDADLRRLHKPGMVAADLYNLYTSFGDAPSLCLSILSMSAQILRRGIMRWNRVQF